MNPLNQDLSSILSTSKSVLMGLPDESKKEKKEPTFCCPWHRKGGQQHADNFGLSRECLDCMSAIQAGRCEIDVCNFDIDIYWPVKRFWDKVDIRGEDECWLWTGATKSKGTETAAYFPSPHHVGTLHGASRVAFWTSRGYTGKLRVFHQKGCSVLCCNPRHLHLRELESIPVPDKITKINLRYGNIFDRAKEARFQSEANSP